MKGMKLPTGMADSDRGPAFTLVEVLVALAILAVGLQSILLCYLRFTQLSELSAYSLTAQTLASQGAEQARSAKWDTQAWPQAVGPGQPDELGLTNYVQTNTLAVGVNGQSAIATNFIGITAASITPPLRQIRSDCVWSFLGRGPFTNTVVMFRAPDQ
jgi:prepilin-type N-terminal cleavage/methylation domain-containing protein